MDQSFETRRVRLGGESFELIGIGDSPGEAKDKLLELLVLLAEGVRVPYSRVPEPSRN